MKIKRMLAVASVAVAIAMVAVSAMAEIVRPVPPSVFVDGVKFRQRYPWNGLVDIDCNVTCSDPTTNIALYVAAWDNVKDRAMTVKTIWVDGDETKNPDLTTKSGAVRIVWDARADNPGEISSDVSVSVQAYVRDMRYLVIDLSGGTNATEYAYYFMPDPPEGGWTDEYKTEKLVLRFIPAGTFLMGSPKDEIGRFSNETLHKVTLTQPFYMAIFETTKTQLSLLLGDSAKGTTPYYASRVYIRGRHDPYDYLTVSEVSPTSVAGVLRSKTGIGTIDLPSEARWEYACRAGTTTAFNDGSNLLTTSVDWDTNMANLGSYNGSSSATVGNYKPNLWGLYDMHGNAAEWCLDGANYNELYPYPQDQGVDPVGRAPYGGSYDLYYSHGYYFVVRGSGSMYFESASNYNTTAKAWGCRSAYRGYAFDKANGDSSYNSAAGFRICCDANLLK